MSDGRRTRCMKLARRMMQEHPDWASAQMEVALAQALMGTGPYAGAPELVGRTQRQQVLYELQQHAGFVAARQHPRTRVWLVLYNSAAQDLDADAGKYAMICTAHGTCIAVPTKAGGVGHLADGGWCEVCEALAVGRCPYHTIPNETQACTYVANPKFTDGGVVERH